MPLKTGSSERLWLIVKKYEQRNLPELRLSKKSKKLSLKTNPPLSPFSKGGLSALIHNYGDVLSFEQEILRHFAPQNDSACHSERSEESQFMTVKIRNRIYEM
jgi:hypothetical protein